LAVRTRSLEALMFTARGPVFRKMLPTHYSRSRERGEAF
jgi:hypothetical protein